MNAARPQSAGWAAAVAVLVLLLGLAVVALPAVAAGTDQAAAPGGGCGPAGTGRTVAGRDLDAEQLANAATIVQVVNARHLPSTAAVVAIATAMQESTLHNRPGGDRDSVGLFQQRVSIYGAAVAADPVKATGAFLDRLVQQPAWATRPLTDAAADIQRPAAGLRGRYAQWQPLAAELTATFWSAPAAAGALPRQSPLTAATGPPEQTTPSGARCTGNDTAGTTEPGAAAQPAPGPAALTLTGSPAGNAAARYAMAQIGKPYVWGGVGPAGYDCSGLTMQAWASAGVAIPRVTYTQVNAGTPVGIQQARSGDLVLVPGSDGTATDPGHVGMIAGTGAGRTTWIVQAPRTGLTIRLTPLSAWADQVVAVRRIG